MASTQVDKITRRTGMSKVARKVAIKFAKPFHDEIARMLVVGHMSQKEICQVLRLSPAWLSLLIQQPMVVIKIKKLQEARDANALSVGAELDAASIPAIAKIERTMYNTKSERLGVHCAEAILDRAGYGRVTKSINTNTNINATANMTKDEMVRLLAKRLGAIKAESDDHFHAVAAAVDVELETQEEYESEPEPEPEPESEPVLELEHVPVEPLNQDKVSPTAQTEEASESSETITYGNPD